MSKINKPLLYKVAGVTGIVSLPLATTLGVVYGTKYESTNMGKTEAVSFGDKFFDENMAEGTSSFAQRQLLTPFRPLEGGGNLSELIRLDAYFDNGGAHRILATDADGNEKTPLGVVAIEVGKSQNADQLSEQFLQANVALERIAKNNPGKEMGIYIGKDLRTREVTAAIYEVKGISDDEKDKFEQYLTDLDIINSIRTTGLSDKKFLQLFGAQNLLKPDLSDYFNVDRGGQTKHDYEQVMINKYMMLMKNGVTDTSEPHGWYNNSWEKYQIDHGQDPAEHFVFGGKDKDEGHFIPTVLAFDNLIPTYETVIDWNRKEVKYVFKMFKVDHKSKIDFDMGDHVYDPIGQYTRTLRIPFSKLIVHPKPTLDAAKRQAARETIKKFLTQDLVEYVQLTFVKNGLPVIGNIIPSVSDALAKVIEVGNLLAYTPSKTSQDHVLQEGIKTDEFLNKLVDRMMTDTSVDFEGAIDLMNKFHKEALEGDEPYWSTLNKIMVMFSTPMIEKGVPDTSPGAQSGQYKLYQLTSFFNSTSEMILDKIKENPKYGLVKADTINSSLLEQLLNYLKQNKIIPSNYELGSIVADPIAEVYKILSSLADKQLPLPDAVIRGALTLVPSSLVSDHIDGIAKALNYLTTDNHLSLVLSLLGSTDTERIKNLQDLVTPANPKDRWDAIGRITQNTHASSEAIQVLFTTIKYTGIIPKQFEIILGDTPVAAESYAKLFANGGANDIYKLVKTVLDHGLFAMMGNTWVEGVDKDDSHSIDAADITKITSWMDRLDRVNLYSLKNGLNELYSGQVDASTIGLQQTDTPSQMKTKFIAYIDTISDDIFDKTMLSLNPSSPATKAAFKTGVQGMSDAQFGGMLQPFINGINGVMAANVIKDPEDELRDSITGYVNAVDETNYNLFATEFNSHVDTLVGFKVTDHLPSKADIDSVVTSSNAPNADGTPASNPQSFEQVLGDQVANWISGFDFNKLQEIGKFINGKSANTVIGTDAATQDDFVRTQIVEKIKANVSTSADLKAIFTKMPIINDFTIRMTNIVDKILSVVKVSGIDLNSVKGLVASYLPTVLSTLDRVVTTPITSQTEKYGILQQMEKNKDLYNLYKVVTTLASSLPLPDGDLLSSFIGIIGGIANNGLNPFITASASNNGVSKLDASSGLISNMLNLLFPSGFVKGDATTAGSMTVPQISTFASGLLGGFSSATDLVNAMTPILGASTMSYEVPTIGGTVADIFRNIYDNHELFTGFVGGIANGYVKGGMLEPIQKIFKTGLLSLTKADFVKIFAGFKQTLSQSIFVKTGISISVILTSINIDLPIIGTLKELAAKMDANVIGDAFYNVVNSPLNSLPGSEIDSVIDLINGFGLLETHIPHLGDTFHTVFTDGISSLQAIQVEDLLNLVGLSPTLREIILEALFGANYKATFITSMNAKITAITIPPKTALVAGAELPRNTQTYETIRTLTDAKKASLQSLMTHNGSMSQIVTEYNQYKEDVRQLNGINTVVSTANAEHARLIHEIQTLTPPAETVLTTTDATLIGQLNGRTYAAIKTKWDAKVAEATVSKTTTQLKSIKSEVETILEEFVQYNKDANKLNNGQSLTLSKAAIIALLKAHHPSGSYTPTVAVWNELKAAGVKVYADSTFTYISQTPLYNHHTELSGEAVVGKVEISIDLLIAAAGRSYSKPKINVDTLEFPQF